MSRKCNEKCLCLKCSKSCMRACRNCSSVMRMGVTKCKEYTSECTQLLLSDFLGKGDEKPIKETQNEFGGK